MRLEYQLNIKDFREANRTQLKGLYIWIIVIFAVSLIKDPFISILFLGLTDAALLALLVNLMIFIALLLMLYWVIRFSVTHTWKSLPSLRDSMLVEVNEDEWFFHTLKIESRANWQTFTRFRETNNLFMLYQSKVCTNLVPKRAFETEEQMNEFRALLQRKIVK